jgi:hypothetical protein
MPAQASTKHHASVLTEDLVRTLRAEYIPYKNGYRALGAKHNLHASTVRDCVKFYSYKNVY